MTNKEFVKEVFEIVFGVGCKEYYISYPQRNFIQEQILEKLTEFRDNALKWEEEENK